MQRRGRKPLATAHVNRLDGSELAKLRLETILDTMRGTVTIPTACQRLGVCESRFHALRQRWLQESLELLEPRPAGRPVKEPDVSDREMELAADKASLEKQLQLTQAKQEVAEIMAATETARSSKKKMRAVRAKGPRGGERRRNQRRPR